MLLLVPFNSKWIAHDKIDIHAIYRRPKFVEDQYGEFQRQLDANGIPMWDLTGPLPVKQHNKWESKGFEYITLANRPSLQVAAQHGTIEGDWKRYDQHQSGGPWNYRKYAEGQNQTTTIAADQLMADINKFGSEAVETIRKTVDKDFTLPAHLKGIPPGGRKVDAVESAESTAADPGRVAPQKKREATAV